VARPATGQVVERRTSGGVVYALRFRADGERQYVTLGSASDGWTRRRAEEELQNILADVRRGQWRRPVEPIGPGTPRDPTFHEFASEWLATRTAELRPTTVLDYRWQLTNHLLPFFAAHRLSQISIKEVDRYRQAKVAEGVLSAESINKTITRLGQVLELAVEYELIARNPARIGRRKLKTTRPRPVHLDSPDQIAALLQAASDLDARSTARTSGRRPLVAALVFAGLRIGEAAALRWRDVDLATRRLTVGASKTDAGMRRVDLVPALVDELIEHKMSAGRTGPDDFVFPTATGSSRDKDNMRERVIRPVVGRADELLLEAGLTPLPEGVTAHKLRHTYASLLVALGNDPAYVMAQLGHTDPKFTLRIYTHGMRRLEGDKERLQALVEGRVWAPMGTGSAEMASEDVSAETPRNDETPDDAGPSDDGRGWFRTSDLSRVKRALSH
jgi:integrase